MKKYNLLEEYTAILDIEGLNEKDIVWCGSEDVKIDYQNLKDLMASTWYNSRAELASDLCITAKNWQMTLNPQDFGDLFDIEYFYPEPKILSSNVYCLCTSDSKSEDMDEFFNTLTELNSL